MAVNLTLRNTKGSPLTFTELDNNFTELKNEFDDLATSDSAVLVGGVEASNLQKDTFKSFINKSLLVALRKKGNSVITGDSLSYNHQDLDATSRATAEACASGMRSWSFMLRDVIKKQDPFFKYLDEMEIGNATANPSSVVSYNVATTAQIMPHGGRLTTLTALPSEAEIFSFNYKHQGAESLAYLLLVGDPTGFGCTYSVSVDGGSVVNSTTVLAQSGINTFQGRRIVLLPIAVPNDGQNHVIRLYNFVQAAAAPDASGLCKLNIIGMSAVSNPVILTGVGGFSTTQLLTQWDIRVTNFNPNALICIIGANDSYQGIPISTFKTNLQTMIDSTRAANTSCEILFMSTPGSASGSEFSVPDATALQYVKAMRDICVTNKCSFFNTFEFAKQPLQSNMLFDWVHFNRAGNRALCAELCDLLGLTYEYSDIDTDYNLLNSSRATVNLKYNGTTFIASPAGTGTNPKTYGIATTQGASGLIQSAISTDGETVRVTFREPITSLGGIAINKRGFSAVRVTPIITAYGTNYVDFKIVKNDGTSLVQHADYPTLVNDLSFNVTY